MKLTFVADLPRSTYPPKTPRKSKYQLMREELAKRPGVWALVFTSKSHSTSSNRAQYNKNVAAGVKPGEIETAVRTVNGAVNVYARVPV